MNQPLNPLDSPAAQDLDAVPMTQHTLAPHDIERDILQRLQNHPSLRFSTLNVHQCGRDSVCLEGFLESNDDEIDLCEIVRGIHGISQVVNRVVTTHPCQSVPKKG